MKFLIIFFLFITIDNLFSQTGWVYLGKEIGYDLYYKENTIVRGNNPFVVVVGVPLKEMKDNNNSVIKYVSVNITFYQSSTGLRCLISNHLYFYEDNTYKKAPLPNRDIPITYYNLLSKLYDAIR